MLIFFIFLLLITTTTTTTTTTTIIIIIIIIIVIIIVFGLRKINLTGQTWNNDTKHVEIMVLLKFLTNFWGTPEIPLINWEIRFEFCKVLQSILVAGIAAGGGPKFYVPIITL